MNKFSCAIMAVSMCVCSLQAKDIECDSTDFWSVIGQVETNYAGFPTKVNAVTSSDYETMKLALWRQVKSGEREGHDAVSEYVAWFCDLHLRTAFSGQYHKVPDYSSVKYMPEYVSKKLSDDTYFLRIPTFNPDSASIADVKNGVADVLESGCRNLIVDVRGNGGGLDLCFGPLIDIIYSHPFTLDGIEIRPTADIAAYLRRVYIEQGNRPGWAPVVADSIEAGASDFVVVPGFEGRTFDRDTVYYSPEKVAIIIDGYVASSAEQFIINSRACSDKVTVYGRDNTMGCIDFSNPLRFDMPCSSLSVMIPISRSMSLRRNAGHDKGGIAPDVRIDLPLPSEITDNTDEWVLWIKEQME